MGIELVRWFTGIHLKGEKVGHDHYHGRRVADLATKMYLSDYPNAHEDSRVVIIIQIGNYLHGIADERTYEDPSEVTAEVEELPPEVGFTELEVQDILFTIQYMSPSSNIERHYELPLSGQYVQDVDRIESLGATRIARVLTYGGEHGNKIYGPEIRPEKLVSHNQCRSYDETIISHFYEKSFGLEGLMNTPTAKKEAYRRTEYIYEFVREPMNEWNV